MSIFFTAMVVVLSTLTGSAVTAAPAVPTSVATIEAFAATVVNDPTGTLRVADRVLVRAHRQLPDADGNCADAGSSDTAVVTPQLASQAVSGSLRAARTTR